MNKLIAGCVALIVLSNGGYAFASGRHGYYYSGGHWWLGDTIVAGLAIGTVIAALPPHYSTVYFGGVPYFYDGVYYYQSSPSGYIVVQPVETLQPVTPVQALPVRSSEVVVPTQSFPTDNTRSVMVPITYSNGTSTNIMLVKKGSGYVGPDGEYYDAMPTMKQLKAVYGQ
ncbi:MAG: DUF6515 family protein [Endomicrobiales bacterium]|jgi:hypothetical protein